MKSNTIYSKFVGFFCKSIPFPRTEWIPLFIIALVGFLSFCSTIAMDFVWEDNIVLFGNSPIKNLSNISSFFVSSAQQGMDVAQSTPYYRPVSNMIVAFEYFLWGENPYFWHFTNVILHILVSLLVYKLAKQISSDKSFAPFFSAVIFATHPVHTETVTYITAASDLHCAIFSSLTLIFYLSFSKNSRIIDLVLSQIFLASALLCKEMAVMIPVLVILYELFSKKNDKIKRICISTVPATLVILYLIIRSQVLSEKNWDNPLLVERFFTGIHVVAKYIVLLIMPTDIRVFYDVPLKFLIFEPQGLISILILDVFLLFIFYLNHIKSKISAAFLSATLITIFPVSLIPGMLLPASMATRYLYIPSIFFSIAVGYILTVIHDRILKENIDKSRILIFFLIIPFFLGIKTVYCASWWKNDKIFYERLLQHAPNHPFTHYAAGNYYGKQGNHIEMARHYQISLRITKERQMAIAKGYFEKGNYDKAEAELLKIEYLRNNPEISAFIEKLRLLHNK